MSENITGNSLRLLRNQLNAYLYNNIVLTDDECQIIYNITESIDIKLKFSRNLTLLPNIIQEYYNNIRLLPTSAQIVDRLRAQYVPTNIPHNIYVHDFTIAKSVWHLYTTYVNNYCVVVNDINIEGLII